MERLTLFRRSGLRWTLRTRSAHQGSGPRRWFLGGLLTWLCLASAGADTPNVIVIMIDDMGYGDGPAIVNPQSQIAMPNLEQLAAGGMTFTDAHSPAALCSPTRYSMLTGNYHWRSRRPQAYGSWWWFGGSAILPDQQTQGHFLQAAGYTTAHVGKWNVAADFYLQGSDDFAPGNPAILETDIDMSRPMRNGPTDMGFDYSFTTIRGLSRSPYAYFENGVLVGDPADLFIWVAGSYGNSEIEATGIGLPDWDSTQMGPILADAALEFVGTAPEPFFLNLWPGAAHSPRTPPVAILGEPVAGVTGVGDESTAHADMIYETDVILGHLLDALDARGIRDNTLIVWTSDNGGVPISNSQGHDSLAGLRGVKGDVWEGGHRVPLVVNWPGRVPAGVMNHQLISGIDLPATFASITGVSLPPDQARDSFDFSEVLLGNSATPVRDHLIVEAAWLPSGGRPFAYREGKWKLVLDPDRVPIHLYDLDADVAETVDLMGTMPDLVAQMHARFTDRMAQDRTAPLAGSEDVDGDGVSDELDNCT